MSLIGSCGKLLIRLGEGCNTGCPGCSENYKKNNFAEKEDVIKNISKIHEIFSPNIEFLLFGIDPLLYEDIFLILKEIRAYNTGDILLHVSDFSHYSDDVLIRIKGILHEFNGIKFLISLDEKSLRDYNFKDLVRVFTFFENANIQLSAQIYYRDKGSLKGNKNFILLTHFKNISLDISKSLVINMNEERVTSEDSSCKFFQNIIFKKNNISFGDLTDFELEVSLNGDVIPHTPRCYLANIKITNIFFDNKKIYSDFVKFSKYIELIQGKTQVFEKNCFHCIFSGEAFDYSKK